MVDESQGELSLQPILLFYLHLFDGPSMMGQ